MSRATCVLFDAGAASWDVFLMAEGFEVKTISCFSRVPLPSRCQINAILSKKDKELLFLTKGDGLLYVIDNGKHTNTYLFPSNIVHFEVLGQTITAVTDDGRTWRIAVTKQKSKKSKHSKNQDAVSSSSQAVFSELLPKEAKNSNQALNANPSVHVTEVLDSQAIFLEPRIQATFTLKDSLISFGASDSGCVLSYYTPRTQQDNNCVSHSQTTFKVCLNVPEDSSLHNDKLWPVPLICYRERTDDNSLFSNIMQRKLFDFLVPTGRTDEPEKASTCLIVIGAPDGQVFTYDLDQTGSQVTKDSSLKLLYHLEQSVVGIHLLYLPQFCTSSKHTRNEGKGNTCKPVHNVVVLIGSKGKCILVYQSEETCCFSKHNLAGPVHCSSVKSSKDSASIIHSNGREICFSKLSVSKIKGPKKDDFSIAISSIFICIPEICCIYPRNTDISDGDGIAPIKAVAMTTNGKLLEISVPESESKFPASLFSKQPGLQLRELLSNIENVAQQTNLLEEDLESIDRVLEQLNYASTLMTSMTRTTRTLPLTVDNTRGNSKSKRYIFWNIMPMPGPGRNILTNRVQYSLKFEVVNQSSMSLSSQWSVLISVQNKNYVLSHKVTLDSLTPLSTREFIITLPELVDLKYGIVVETYLCYEISWSSSALPSELKAEPNVNNNILVISLGQKVIDILSFAKHLVDFSSHNTFNFSLTKPILDLEHLKSSDIENKGICPVDEKLFAVVVPISKGFLHSIASIGLEDKSLEEKLLRLLLGDLNDSCKPQKAQAIVQGGKDTRCTNFSIMVIESTSTDEPSDGLDIVLKASTKVGLITFLEAVIAKLKFLLVTSESRVSTVRPDDLQRLLKTVQEFSVFVMSNKNLTS